MALGLPQVMTNNLAGVTGDEEQRAPPPVSEREIGERLIGPEGKHVGHERRARGNSEAIPQLGTWRSRCSCESRDAVELLGGGGGLLRATRGEGNHHDEEAGEPLVHATRIPRGRGPIGASDALIPERGADLALARRGQLRRHLAALSRVDLSVELAEQHGERRVGDATFSRPHPGDPCLSIRQVERPQHRQSLRDVRRWFIALDHARE